MSTGHGTVIAFDDEKGWGSIAEDAIDGGDGPEWFFHCTAIADGTRTIEVGTTVEFVLAPGHNGRYEARRVQPSG